LIAHVPTYYLPTLAIFLIPANGRCVFGVGSVSIVQVNGLGRIAHKLSLSNGFSELGHAAVKNLLGRFRHAHESFCGDWLALH